jgi:peptidylprolyl isomerase
MTMLVTRGSVGGRAGVLLVTALVTTCSAVLVTGCSPEIPDAGPEAVQVEGAFGQRPRVTFDVPLAVREPSVTVLIDGEGPVLSEGAPVLVDWIALDGSTGEVIAETYPTAPEVFAFTRESLGDDLFAAVSGSGTNDRVLYLEPATGSSGLPAAHIVVVDVRPAIAQGEPVQPQPGLPQVTAAEDGSPVVTLPGSAPPPDRVEQLLIRGRGEQVAANGELIVQYSVVRWSDGQVEASTWGEGRLPQRLDLATSVPGLSVGLLDHTVGSRVMLVVPPREALGTDTLVYVVDILAIVSEPTAEPTPAGTASPAAADAAAGASASRTD